MDLKDLRIANERRDKEWDPEHKLSLSYKSNEMAGECGEACNEVKKLERELLGIKGSTTTLQKAADELADVIITADLVAMALGINLSTAVINKFNATSRKVGLSVYIMPEYEE